MKTGLSRTTRGSLLASARPLKRTLGGLVGGLRGRRCAVDCKGAIDCKGSQRPLSPAPSLRTASTRSDLSDASHLSELVDDLHEEAAPLPLFEDESMHLRWSAALAGRQPEELEADELRRLIVGGMPLKYRLALWPRWFSLPPGAVGSVEDLQRLAPVEVAAQIDLDVPRTHPHWPLGDAERLALRRVLLACAARHPEVGYCQGMGHMAAVLVALGFDEDTALRGLCSLLESCCEGYHDAALSGLRRDAAVLAELAGAALSPEAALRLKALDVPLEALASEHFLTLGSRAWPLAAAVRLWDLALLEGPPAVFCSFLALLEEFLPGDQDAAGLEAAWRGGEQEPVEVFKERALLGLTEAPREVLERTQRIMEKVPLCLLEELRSGL